MQSLFQISNPQALYLLAMPVDDAIFGKICKSFPKLRDFRLVSISHDLFTAVGLEFLSELAFLEHLWMADIPINDTAFIKIASRCKKLKSLVLHGGHLRNVDLTSKGIEAVVKLEKLEELDLEHLSIVDSAFIKICTSCHSLQKIYLSECQELSSKAVQALSKVKDLKEIILKNITIDDAALEKICRHCKEIQKLHLINCQALSQKGLKALSSVSSLKEIRISHSKMDDTVLKKFSGGLSNLEILSLANCPFVTSKGAKALLNLPKLRYVFFHEVNIDSQTQKQIHKSLLER
jgi:hypothetical protein